MTKKHCICSKNEVEEHKGNIFAGISISLIIVLFSSASILATPPGQLPYGLIALSIWLAFCLAVFSFRFIQKLHKGHSFLCSMRYALIDLFYGSYTL